MERRKFLRSFGLLGLASIFAPKLLADENDSKLYNKHFGAVKDTHLSFVVNDKTHSLSGFSVVRATPQIKMPKVSDGVYYSEIKCPISTVSDDGVVKLKMKDDNLMRGHVVELFGGILCFVKLVEEDNVVTLCNVKKEWFCVSKLTKFVYIRWTAYDKKL